MVELSRSYKEGVGFYFLCLNLWPSIFYSSLVLSGVSHSVILSSPLRFFICEVTNTESF